MNVEGQTGETSQLRRCPKCDTELRDAVLSGQCPACMVKLIRDPDPVGSSRCDDPARAVAGGTVAPLHAARTAQRTTAIEAGGLCDDFECTK